ncbi:MAG TPA: prolipoprotein diacylglyceryl transferase [Thermoguttaceae bacterium]|nr:prolipoprotein diacylglyceryl transferase [Thermoguttaceae bacterium]
MYPTLLRLPWIGGSWNLPTYSAALTTGLFVFCLVGWFGVRRQGGGVGSAAWYVLAVTVSMLVGARIAYGALRPDGFSKPWNELLILDFGHFYLLGGFLAAAAVGWPLSRAIRLDPWRMLDALAPAAAAAMAIVRLGCYGAGCCFGKETTAPWAVQFPPGSLSHLYQLQYDLAILFTGPRPVHPTQLYLAATALVVLAAVLVLQRYVRRPGLIALWAALLWLSLRC